MALFADYFRSWALGRYRKDLAEHIRHLKGLGDKDMGLMLAIVQHQRNALIKDGTDMTDLAGVVNEKPTYHRELAEAAAVLKRKKRPHDAFGLMVWADSLRAVQSPELMSDAVTLWRELRRGRKNLKQAEKDVRDATGFELDLTDADKLPAEILSD